MIEVLSSSWNGLPNTVSQKSNNWNEWKKSFSNVNHKLTFYISNADWAFIWNRYLKNHQLPAGLCWSVFLLRFWPFLWFLFHFILLLNCLMFSLFASYVFDFSFADSLFTKKTVKEMTSKLDKTVRLFIGYFYFFK